MRSSLVVLAAPIVALPMLAIESDVPAIGRTAWVAALMAIYWATECLPMAVTSLLPMVLFPLLGVLPADAVSRNYFQDKIVLFFGGLIIACALELVDLHRRVALRVLLLFGARPPQLLLGFMVSTAFISMWMSNTATAAMMMPIAEAVLLQLEHAARDAIRPTATSRCSGAMATATGPAAVGDAAEDEAAAAAQTAAPAEAVAEADAEAARRFRPLGKAMVLSIAYAANIGGMATLTGTGPNLVLAGDIAAIYPHAPGLSFANWLLFGLPLAALLLLSAWALITIVMLRGSSRLYQPSHVRASLQAQYNSLGRMTWRERLVLADFVLLAVLWISRSPKFVPGWGALFRTHYVTDGTVAVLMASLLFALPAEPPSLFCGARHATVTDSSSAAGSVVAGSPARRAARAVRLRDSPPDQRSGSHLLGRRSRVPSELSLGSIVANTSRDVELHAEIVPAAAPRNGAPSSAHAGPAAAAQPSPPPSPPPPSSSSKSYVQLIEWKRVQPLLPWHVILLLGGGFALADACMRSGLSASVGANLASLRGLPPSLVSLLLMLIVSATTAVTSNVATASIFLPVVSGLADSMGVHPLSYMIPTALTTSLAFVLPVSTPPNAMAFASGRLEVRDMVGLGLCMNAIGVLAILVAMNTIAIPIFHLDAEPVPDFWTYGGGNGTHDGGGESEP